MEVTAQRRSRSDLPALLAQWGVDGSGLPKSKNQSGGKPSKPAICCTWISTVFGDMLAAATEDGICLLEFDDCNPVAGEVSEVARLPLQVQRVSKRFQQPFCTRRHPHLTHLRTELKAYLTGRQQRFSVPLATRGTSFQQSVWAALQELPYGTTVSYQDLAALAGRPRSIRAVGAANGANPLALLVPCHRVIGSGGSLTGYSGGLERKQWLLQLESGQRKRWRSAR